MAKKKSAKKAATASRGHSKPAKPAPAKAKKAAAKKAGHVPKKVVKPTPAKAKKKVDPKAKPAPVKGKPAAKPAKKAAKAGVKKAASPAKKAAPVAKKAPATAKKAAAKKAAAPVNKVVPVAKKAAPAVKAVPAPAPVVKAPVTPVPAPTAKVAAPAAKKAAAPAVKRVLTPALTIPSRIISPDRPRSLLGVAALPPGGLPDWWSWHQEYPGDETLRRGTVLTSFNLYLGIYTDTFRIHMAAGQNGIRAVSYSSKFGIDGDGSGGKQRGDVDFKDNTSLHYFDGNPPSKKNALNSLTYPFAVLPLPPRTSSIPDFHALGLDVGDIGIAFFGRGKAAPFIFGDEGPPHQVGEGSIQMAEDLGMNWEPRMNTTPAKGGFNASEMRDYAPGVLHVAFPGSRDRPDKTTELLTREALQAKAWDLFRRWKQSLRGGPA